MSGFCAIPAPCDGPLPLWIIKNLGSADAIARAGAAGLIRRLRAAGFHPHTTTTEKVVAWALPSHRVSFPFSTDCAKTSPLLCPRPPSKTPAARHATPAQRILDPATTLYLFLLQVLHGNTACRHVVHCGGWSFSESAYCQARKRLPLAVVHCLLEATAGTLRAATSETSRWLKHRVWLVDGSRNRIKGTCWLLQVLKIKMSHLSVPSRGRSSLPIQVSSNLVFPLIPVSHP